MFGAGLADLRRIESLVKRRHVGLADPADDEILLYGGADCAVGETATDVHQCANLIGRDIAER